MLRFVDEDVHMEDAVQRQVGHQHAEADGQQQQRLKLVDNGQVQQHAGHADHDGILPAALGKEDLRPTGVGKDLSDVGKNCSHCFVPFPSHKRRGVLGNAGVAPGAAAGTSSRLFLNAVNAADGQVFTQRGNGCSNGSNDLAGDGAVRSKASRTAW